MGIPLGFGQQNRTESFSFSRLHPVKVEINIPVRREEEEQEKSGGCFKEQISTWWILYWVSVSWTLDSSLSCLGCGGCFKEQIKELWVFHWVSVSRILGQQNRTESFHFHCEILSFSRLRPAKVEISIPGMEKMNKKRFSIKSCIADYVVWDLDGVLKNRWRHGGYSIKLRYHEYLVQVLISNQIVYCGLCCLRSGGFLKNRWWNGGYYIGFRCRGCLVRVSVSKTEPKAFVSMPKFLLFRDCIPLRWK
ncbi:hypothetical protein CEXT_565771 [Caerostris extrusa]|uniref:Uncharacterized protein n=1 Tax=Caerostris extrusa TaxID=172846 RepID=A0AAV4NAG0_CAEEX|nr:hypothetical protein CEXT_565771 [Caerostris extrusa]